MTRQRFGRLVMIVVVFVLAGPVIGLLIAASAAGVAFAVSGDPAGGAATAAFILLYGWVFAHFMGVVPAAVAGLIVATWSWGRGKVSMVVGASAGLMAMGSTHLPLTGSMPRWPSGSDAAAAMILLAAHVASAMACSYLTRRWQ